VRLGRVANVGSRRIARRNCERPSKVLKWVAGARVVVELSQVSGFDFGRIEELTDAAMAQYIATLTCARW
jgi:hypothetical protein